MKKEDIILKEIKLVGLCIQTNNNAIFQSGEAYNNDISKTIQRYFQEGGSQKIQNLTNPGITYCVYTKYESDYRGDYTYFIGEEVTSIGDLAPGFTALTIPPQYYIKFTNEPGPMPGVCIDMWQKIWALSQEDLRFERAYEADFELYDHRAVDPKNTVLDIFIGIKKKTEQL